MANKPRPIRRNPARSGRSSYSAPVVIRAGRDTHLEVLLQYVKRSDGDSLSPKLSYWKKTAGGFRIGFPAEFTLNEGETRHLVRVLQEGLALAEAGEDGSFLLLRLDGTAAETSEHGADALSRAMAPLISDPEIIDALASLPSSQKILEALEGSLRVAQFTDAVGQLASALADGVTAEGFYQKWVEGSTWAFGNMYAMQDEVRTIALGDQVDALLAATANGLRDVIELKRPDHEVIGYDSTHRSYYWRSEAAKAIGQCHRYMDALHEAAAKGLRDHPEIIAYHPRSIIVIGRSEGWGEAKLRALHGLNARLHWISVMTYDQLLAQARRTLDSLRGAAS